MIPAVIAVEQQQITLHLEDSVTYRTQSNRVALRDMELQFFIDESGAISSRGWALIEDTGPVWLPVEVGSREWDGNSLQTTALIDMPHLWPQRTGGTIEIIIEASRKGRRLSGHYLTSSDGLTSKELAELMVERLKRSTPPRQFNGQLISSQISSQEPPPPVLLPWLTFLMTSPIMLHCAELLVPLRLLAYHQN